MRFGKKRIGLAGIFTAGALLFSTASLWPTHRVSAIASLMSDDIVSMQIIEAESPEISYEQIPMMQAASDADETDYDEDCYASYAGYDALNEQQKQLYNSLKEAAHQYYIGASTVQTVSYSGGSVYCFASVSLSMGNTMTTDDLAKTISMFRSDNPIYFFVGDSMLYSTRTLPYTGYSYINAVYLTCEDTFADETVCQAERIVLEENIALAQNAMTSDANALECATAAHNWINERITYAYDENGDPDDSMISHSIVGVFDPTYQAAVCEGYAKAFQLLLNAAGIENYYIVGLGNGGGHAWNMVRMDDGYFYYFDLTWDDSTESTRYFAAGEISFSQQHTAFTTDNVGWEFLYDLPDVPNADYTLSDSSVYVSGDFVYQLYDTYAVLTEYHGDAVSVTIPETANGLPVTQIKGAFLNDANLQSVVIPDTVIAISYGENSTGAFEGCVSLKEVTLPIGLQRIEYRAFYACSALETISIPVTVERVGAGAFDGCNSLGQILFYTEDCTFVSSSSVYADTVIYGYADSTAEAYASQYSRMFVELINTQTTTTQMVEATTETTAETTALTQTETDVSSVTTECHTDASTESTSVSDVPELVSDIDRDGICTLSDLVLLNRYVIGTLPTLPVDESLVDCYRDGMIDARDCTVLMRFLLRVITELPVYPES